MSQEPIFALADVATEAHTRIQQDFSDINPVVGVRRSMRENGIPADAMTIDCLTQHKRIILILHDNQPDTVHYQFGFTDKDPLEEFKSMPLAELSAQTLYDWIASYFANRMQ